MMFADVSLTLHPQSDNAQDRDRCGQTSDAFHADRPKECGCLGHEERGDSGLRMSGEPYAVMSPDQIAKNHCQRQAER